MSRRDQRLMTENAELRAQLARSYATVRTLIRTPQVARLRRALRACARYRAELADRDRQILALHRQTDRVLYEPAGPARLDLGRGWQARREDKPRRRADKPGGAS